MENSFPFVRPACVGLDSARPSSHHQSTRTIRTSHVAAPGRCAHHPGITPEGVICVIVITARWAAALGILSRARPVACASGADSEVRCARGQSPVSVVLGGERSGPAVTVVVAKVFGRRAGGDGEEVLAQCLADVCRQEWMVAKAVAPPGRRTSPRGTADDIPGATGQVGRSPTRVDTKRRCPVKQARLPGPPRHRHPPLPVWSCIHAYFLAGPRPPGEHGRPREHQ